MKTACRDLFFLCVLPLTACAPGIQPHVPATKTFVQKTYATVEDAVSALGTTHARNDMRGVAEILGDKDYRLVSSGDPVMDRHEANYFRSLYEGGHEVELQGNDSAILSLGLERQPYPIGLVREAGLWRFDSSEGSEVLLSRRISKTELIALSVVTAYVDAQRDYYSQDWNGEGIREYAQQFGSSLGKHDGLYWGKAGPLAALSETAWQEGYREKKGEPVVYRGYVYKILKSQGASAPGGLQDYLVDGRMTKGFALVAFPARYGVSGVLTYLVNQEGAVYQNDLGPQTQELGQAMTQFDPDLNWSKGVSN